MQLSCTKLHLGTYIILCRLVMAYYKLLYKVGGIIVTWGVGIFFHKKAIGLHIWETPKVWHIATPNSLYLGIGGLSDVRSKGME